MKRVKILRGDARLILPTLEAKLIHCCVTSPPYWGLRDYGTDGQLGLEPTPDAYVANMVAVFREVRRVLRDDGTLWLNLGDSYRTRGGDIFIKGSAGKPTKNVDAKSFQIAASAMAAGETDRKTGLKPKDLVGIPWRVAFALQADGWWLRQDIIWSKPNPMPESITDRCTKAHEYIFLLSKSARYYYDAEAIKTKTINPGQICGTGEKSLSRGQAKGAGIAASGNGVDGGFCINPEMSNKRSVWEVATAPFSEAHFATFPPALIEPCILAGCPKGGMVLDPFGGAGTTGLVADRLQRNAILIELNHNYADMARTRIIDDLPLFAAVECDP